MLLTPLSAKFWLHRGEWGCQSKKGNPAIRDRIRHLLTQWVTLIHRGGSLNSIDTHYPNCNEFGWNQNKRASGWFHTSPAAQSNPQMPDKKSGVRKTSPKPHWKRRTGAGEVAQPSTTEAASLQEASRAALCKDGFASTRAATEGPGLETELCQLWLQRCLAAARRHTCRKHQSVLGKTRVLKAFLVTDSPKYNVS